MNYKEFIFVIFFIHISFFAFGQTSYSKVKVDLTNHSIKELAAVGVEADHGHVKLGRFIINDYSAAEITLIREAGFKVEVIIEDVIEHYRSQSVLPSSHHSHQHDGSRNEDCNSSPIINDRFNYPTPVNYTYGSMGGYLTYDELLVVLDSMHAKFPNLISSRAAISDIPSIEGRLLQYVKISDNPEIDEEAEPELLYTALHHAREPNSLSQLVFYMWYLLENYETDTEIKFIVDNTELFFAPCINPDGYVYNQTTNPGGGGLWRKNRRVNDDGSFGVDLNRNYGYKWGIDNTGSSPTPGSDVYRGTEPFSEPELQAVKEFCERYDFEVALNYHTYGNLLIHPWGYSDTLTDEHSTFRAIGSEMKKENNYLFGTGIETVGYTVNGDSDDWMYGDRGMFVMTPEVGPGMYSFWPPSSAIDSLNKTSMYTNIVAAKSLHPFMVFNSLDDDKVLNTVENELKVNFQNIGLRIGSFDVFVTEITGFTNMQPFTMTYSDLDHLQKDSLSLAYSVLSTSTNDVMFELRAVSSSFTTIDTITKVNEILDPNLEYSTILDDDFSTIDDWASETGWGLTTDTYYSAPSSLTESPDGDYKNGRDYIVDLLTPISLVSAETAFIEFKAKWNIEEDWDYVQLLVSTDQTIYTPQCGLFTNLGTINQDFETSLYDGATTDWVNEKIDLSDYIGEVIYIRLQLISDNFETEDGFYIDDVKVVITEEENSNEEHSLIPLTLSPNPIVDVLHIEFDKDIDFDSPSVHIYDLSGKLVFESILTKRDINLKELSSGMYILELNNGDDLIAREKIVKL